MADLVTYYRNLEWKDRIDNGSFCCSHCNCNLNGNIFTKDHELFCKNCEREVDFDQLKKQLTGPRTEFTTLYRPVGQAEWDKIESSGCKKFPPRLQWQPIFYPVLNFKYACEIAEEWNTEDEASQHKGIVTKFEVKTDFLDNYTPECVGGSHHVEYWIPSEELEQLNSSINGKIEVVKVFDKN